jgi:perosamine synthetase
LSFNGNKVVTTGGGGAILTNDDDLADRAKHLTTTAKIPHPWEYEHDAPAWNFRMPNLNAALGCAQMEHLAQMLESKRLLAGRYINSFSSSEYFEVVEEPTGCQSNYWLIAIRMKEPSQTLRNSLIKAASDAGFGCRPAWNLLHTLPMYRNAPSADLTNAQQLLESLINVPSSACLVPR